MKVEAEGKTYTVRWMHKTLGREIKYKADTICVISEDSEESAKDIVGRALCGKHDNFNKNRGRKLSMTRALKAGKFNSHTRRKFWWAYYQMRGGKW